MKHKPQKVAGLDCAFSGDKKRIVAVAVVFELPAFRVVETAEVVMSCCTRYRLPEPARLAHQRVSNLR